MATPPVIRRRGLSGTPEAWAANDAVIKHGEIAVEHVVGGPSKMKVGFGNQKYSELPYLSVNPQSWDEITDKPATFPPSPHDHDWDEITGKPSTFPPSPHGHDWADITGKPSVFPPDPEVIDDRVAALLVAGANVGLVYDDTANTLTISSSAAGGGGGTVLSVSVVSANGFAGTVASPTVSPAITMSTTVTGMLKGAAGALTLAVAGTDYLTPAGASAIYAPISHTHTVSQITDFYEQTDDRVASLIVAGTNITSTYNDAANTLTIAAAAYPTTLPPSGAAGGALTGTYPNPSLSASASLPWSQLTGVPATFPPSAHTQTASTITDFSEAVDDRVGALVVGGANITATYNDAANTLTIAAAAYPTSLPPSGTAGGDLAGTYPNPTIKSNVSLTGVPLLTTAPLAGVVANEIVTAAWVNAKGYTTNLGTVTTLSVVSTNGFAGSVATPSTTPAITLSTTITGMLKGAAGALALAVAGTDYASATHNHDLVYAPISHTHTASQITDFSEAVDDRVGALIVGGTNITSTYNDVANTLTISAAAYPTSLPPSGAAGGDLTGTYPNPTIEASVALTGTPTAPTPGAVTSTEIVNAAWVLGKGYQTVTAANAAYAPISHTHTASQITDFAEATDDRVAALIVGGTNITSTYNDAANTLTIAAAAYPTSLPPSGAASGDLAGTYPSPTIKASVGLTGTPTAPTPGAVTSTEIVNAAWVLGKGYEVAANKGAASGYAPLDSTSKVPAIYLPAYVDDVLEFANLAAFPATGTAGVIYVALDTNKVYRWSGSTYTEISPSPGSTDAVPEGSTNLYFTNERVDDRVAVLIVGGTNITSTYNDAANTLTIAAAAYPTSLPPSGAAGGDLTGTYPNPTIEASVALTGTPTAPTPGAVTGTELVTAAWVLGKGYQTVAAANAAYAPISHTHTASQITDFAEATDDRVAALIVGGTNITATYNDVANTLTIAAAAYPTSLPPSGTAAGDLAGTYPNPTIKSSVGLTGTPTAPTPGAVTGTELVTAAWVLAKGYSTTVGTVTTVSVAPANGFAGTVATPTTTPAITLTTSITGMLKGAASALALAVAGTDYVSPSGLTTALGSYLPLVGGTLTGNVTNTGGFFRSNRLGDAAAATFYLDADLSFEAQFALSTTNYRWIFGKDAAAESGSNTGSNFFLEARADGGGSIGNTLTINRATRVVNFPVTPTTPTPGAVTGTEIVTAGWVLGKGYTTNVGTVTSTSVVSTNGFAGTVATATTTPAITLTTTITGMLKGAASALALAVAGTDYMTPANVSAAYLPIANPAFTGTLTGPAATLTGTVTGATITATGAGGVNASGGNFTNDRTGDAAHSGLDIRVDNSFLGLIDFRTGALARWRFQKLNGTETSPTNVGSDFAIQAFDDLGASLGNALTITRATRLTNFLVTPTAPTMATGNNSTSLATTAFVQTEITAYRWKLPADTTFYLSPAGSDLNTGLSSGTAMRQPQALIDYLKRSVDFGGKRVSVIIADGTYQPLSITAPFVGENSSNIVSLTGNVTTPANVIFTSSTGNHALRLMFGMLKVSGISFSTTGSGGAACFIGKHAYLEHDNCRFGPAIEECIIALQHSYMASFGPTWFTGNALSCLHVTTKAKVVFQSGQNVTWLGSPVYTEYVAGLNDATVAFGGANLIGGKTGDTLVHWGSTLNLNDTTGDPLYGTAAGNGPEVTGHSIINFIPVQDTIYVRDTAVGNESDGYVDTDARAFKSIGGAISWLKKRWYEPYASKNPVIKVAGSATAYAAISLTDIPYVDSVILEGDITTPANVKIAGTATAAILSGNKITPWIVRGFTLSSTSAGCISLGTNSTVRFSNIVCGAVHSTASHLTVPRDAYLEAIGNYTISSGCTNHIECETGIVFIAGVTVTITGTPAFTNKFITVIGRGYARLSPTWSGSATGTRYGVSDNSILYAAGTTVPGSVAGGEFTGGRYIA